MSSLKFNRLPEIDREMGAQGLTFVNEFADAIVRHAKENAPVRTGYLRDHIHTEQVDGETVAAVSDAEYSGDVNFGTMHMPPRPFFGDAVEQARADVEQIVRKAFG